jgi:uncharacterized protein (TIGR00661 family)
MIKRKIKILYSINGEGLGHVTRSIPMIQALSKKYDVKVIVGSERSGNFLKKYIPHAKSYEGLKFVYFRNKVKLYDTIKQNAKLLLNKNSNFREVYKIIRLFKPDVIISDCDYLTISVAKLFDIPLICVCNIHSISEMKFPVPRKYRKQYYAEKIPTKIFTSNVDYHVITTFFTLPVRKNNVYLCPPILRDEILNTNPKRQNYYLVYQTSPTNDKLIKVLKQINEKFIVYGFEKESIEKNVTFRKTNNDQFFKDFKNCKACIANGGFTFISEAISLHKPIFSIPISGTFEQALNAMQLEKLGYGMLCEVANKRALKKFIKNNEIYYGNLKKYHKENNNKTVKIIENIIKEATS